MYRITAYIIHGVSILNNDMYRVIHQAFSLRFPSTMNNRTVTQNLILEIFNYIFTGTFSNIFKY